MPTQSHVIELALDLARMPALARTSGLPAIPPNVDEIMQIAAASPKACQNAAAATGEPESVLIDAARFYLQQLLLRPDADCYRVLGVQAGTPRAITRSHMRLLLQWLHPDHNGNLESVYAERVLKAWREVSAGNGPFEAADAPASNGASASIRLPWIEVPIKRRRAFFAWVLPAGITVVVLALWAANYYFGPDHGEIEVGRAKIPVAQPAICCATDAVGILRGSMRRELPNPAAP